MERSQSRVAVTCQACGKVEHVIPHRAARYICCSRPCRSVWLRDHPYKPGVHVTCEQCGKVLRVQPNLGDKRRFCDRTCSDRAKEKKTTVRCTECGKIEAVHLGRAKEYRFCSRTCSATWRKRERPGLKKKYPAKRWNQAITCLHCGETKTVETTTADRKYCSEDCKNAAHKRRMRGKGNSHWDGGTTDTGNRVRGTSEYKAWRKAVFERDGYACTICGAAQGNNLHAHHVKPVATHPEFVFEVSNGATLCVECHKDVHRGPGRVRERSRLGEYLESVGWEIGMLPKPPVKKRRGPPGPRTCEHCGSIYAPSPNNSNQRFCKAKCWEAANPKQIINCERCSKRVIVFGAGVRQCRACRRTTNLTDISPPS